MRELDSVLGDMRSFIRRQIAAGFDSPASIANSAVEFVAGETEVKDLRPFAEQMTKEAVAAHMRDQATWPDVTDCDRVDDAFAELNRSGIVCRQNFTCCSNCGHYEIGDEMKAEKDDGLVVRGYAFYHMQDTERAADGGGLFVRFGCVSPGEAEGTRIGQEIVEALKRQHLTTTWNGKFDTCIYVPLDWKRRRALEVRA